MVSSVKAQCLCEGDNFYAHVDHTYTIDQYNKDTLT